MLRLVIADDEKIIRETISILIDWRALGIEVVAVCKNGLEAYDAVIDEHPDIVLTDIKMPGFSGLELIQRLTQTHEDIQFIIISGHREFDFTVEAMRYGVKHYLLKPCNEQKIIDCIKEVKKEIAKKQLKKSQDQQAEDHLFGFQKNLIRNIITESLLSNMELTQLLTLYESYINTQQTKHQLCYFYYLEEENVMQCARKLYSMLAKDFPNSFCCFLYINNILLVILEDFGGDYYILDEYSKQISFHHQTVSIEYFRTPFDNLLSLLQLLVEKLKRYDIIYFIEENMKIPILNYDSCLQIAREIIKEIPVAKKEDIKRIQSDLRSLGSTIQNEEFLRVLVTNMLLTQNLSTSQNHYPIISELLLDINTTSHPKEVYRRFIESIELLAMEQKTTVSQYKPFIEKIFLCVEELLSDPSLSLKWIAEKYLYMNVDHVGKQFLKQTGKRFSQYLNEKRIEKAKELLLYCQNDAIYLVAEQVGCGNNPQYFSQLFKKYTEYTPSEYIKKYRVHRIEKESSKVM